MPSEASPQRQQNERAAMHPLDRAETAIVAAQVAARDALRAHGIEPMHLVINLVWTEGDSTWACANAIPPNCDEMLPASLNASYEEAVEAAGQDGGAS